MSSVEKVEFYTYLDTYCTGELRHTYDQSSLIRNHQRLTPHPMKPCCTNTEVHSEHVTTARERKAFSNESLKLTARGRRAWGAASMDIVHCPHVTHKGVQVALDG